MDVEIVKVQVPLNAPGPALIYDRERAHMETRTLHKREAKMMGDDAKIYCTASWSGRTWSIGARVEDQENMDKIVPNIMCPDCRNNGYLVAYVDGPNYSGPTTLECFRCKGTGIINAQTEQWMRCGGTHRTWRVAQHESISECAVKLGITPQELTDMEHGRSDPSLLVAATPECLR